MSSTLNILYRTLSVLLISAFCLLQSHSYVLADVETPTMAPPKILKTFSAIGYVSEIDGVLVRIDKANGSDGSKNVNYSFDYSVAKIENQYYEPLNILNVSVGDKVIAQGGLDGNYFIAKRIIVFATNKQKINEEQVQDSTKLDLNKVDGGETINLSDATSSSSVENSTSSVISEVSVGTSTNVTTDTDANDLNSTSTASSTERNVLDNIDAAISSSSTSTSSDSLIDKNVNDSTGLTSDSTSTSVVSTSTQGDSVNVNQSSDSPNSGFTSTDSPDPIVDSSPVIGSRTEDDVAENVLVKVDDDSNSNNVLQNDNESTVNVDVTVE